MGIIELIIKSIKKNKYFYFDNIKTYKNFIYIDDVVNIIDILISKNVKNKILNIGNENISFKILSKFLKKQINRTSMFINKNLNIKKTLSQKIDNTSLKKIIKTYKFQTLNNYLLHELRNKKIL